MKVHRLVIISRVEGGRPIATVEDIVSLALAVEDNLLFDDVPSRRDRLIAGEKIKLQVIAAGIKSEITLVPAHAINRQGVLRRRNELRSR